MKRLALSVSLSLCLLACLWPMKVWGAEGTDTPDTPPEAPKSCAVTEGCSLEEGHEGDCVLHEARYQAEEGGEWVYDALADACAYVYEGGTVEVLRDIDPSVAIDLRKPLTLTSADPENPCKIVHTNKSEHDPYSVTVYADVTLTHIILDGGREDGRTTHTELLGVRSHTLTLGEGAILQNNSNVDTAEGGGGLRVLNSATAVMLKGSVIRNCQGKFGGGAAVASSNSTLILNGGTIEGCEAHTGGGIYVQNGGKLLVTGDSSIRGNAAKKTIEGLPASSGGPAGCGGGIYLKNCQEFQMQGGTVAGNTAEVAGGGAYVQAARVQLTGGEITENRAGDYGGGVVTTYAAAFMLDDTPNVTGNTSKSGFDNLLLDGMEDEYPSISTRPIVITAPLSDNAVIGVSRWTKPNDTHLYRVVAKPAEGYTITTDDLDKFYSDDPKYVTLLHNNLEDSNDPDNGTIVITHADVAFDNQGHGKRPPSQLIDADKLVTKPEDPAEPGYTFESWYTEPECKTEWEFAEDKVTTDEKPQVLYAKWELNHYLIEYDLGEGGENDPANPDDYTVESENITLREPTRDGYQFMGWTLTELDEDLVASREPLSPTSRSRRSARSATADEQQDGIPAGSIGYRKFTALWKKLPPYTVTYTDGVEDAEVFPDQVTGGLENEAATPAFEGTPARPGYTFTGWAPEVAETVTDDAVYVAQWKKNPPPPPSDDDDDDPPPKPPVTPPALESEEHFAYVVGYPDGTVRPEGNITRSEVVSIFFRLMTDEFREEHWAESNPFPDVDGEDWYHHAASTAVKAGLIRGLPDGTFGGERSITRAEFAAIAARFLSEETAPDSGFADLEGHWAKEEVDRAVDAGWIKGYPDGNFHPDEYITRAQVMTLVNRMLGRTPDTDGMREDMVRWPDCPQDAWYYADVQEATNSHAYEREAAGEPETWTALTENRDWTALER